VTKTDDDERHDAAHLEVNENQEMRQLALVSAWATTASRKCCGMVMMMIPFPQPMPSSTSAAFPPHRDASTATTTTATGAVARVALTQRPRPSSSVWTTFSFRAAADEDVSEDGTCSSSVSGDGCGTGSEDADYDDCCCSERVCLRPATVADVETVLKWDDADHMQDCMGANDVEGDGWNWTYELGRDPEPAWRRQLVAEAIVAPNGRSFNGGDGNGTITGDGAHGDGHEEEDGDAAATVTNEVGGRPPSVGGSRRGGRRKPIGFVQIIDPALEESGYWAQARREESTSGTDGMEIGGNNDDGEGGYPRKADEFDFTTMSPFEHRAIDIWIGEENYLGVGYGTEMMKLTLDHYCFGRGDGAAVSSATDTSRVTTVWVDPMADNVGAHRFYQRFGFRPFGIRYFGPDRTLVHRLDRTTWEQNAKWRMLVKDEKRAN
jgi:RimJ/RimL family protein N-acetyltransferase